MYQLAALHQVAFKVFKNFNFEFKSFGSLRLKSFYSLHFRKMYVLSEMKDLVHVKPWQFDQDLRVVIEEELNKKLANKVIYQLGLCVALFDVLKIENSFIFPGDGSSHTRVTFRYVIFRPFIDEILIGKVKSCNKDGVFVTLSFFEDIFIPVSNLQNSSKFDENEQLFIWQYNTGDQTHDLYMDIGEPIR